MRALAGPAVASVLAHPEVVAALTFATEARCEDCGAVSQPGRRYCDDGPCRDDALRRSRRRWWAAHGSERRQRRRLEVA